jgi:hypothetical protein
LVSEDCSCGSTRSVPKSQTWRGFAAEEELNLL